MQANAIASVDGLESTAISEVGRRQTEWSGVYMNYIRICSI